MAQMSLVIRLMEKLLPGLGVGSEPWKDVSKAMSLLGKHIPPGAVSSGVENSAMQGAQNAQRQNSPMIAAMRGGQGGPPPGPGAGAPPMPAAA